MSHYHLETVYRRESMGGHMLDWSQEPDPFKTYLYREPSSLPRPHVPQAPFWDLILGRFPEGWPEAPELDAASLSAILLLSAGLTRPHPGGGGGLRAAASAGALYPAELYFIASGIPGLADGAWHFSPRGPGLHHLWAAPLAGALAKLTARPPSALTFVITAMIWRSLWKYRTRAYRYCLLDSGHLLANLELACLALGQKPRSRINFSDQALSVLLGLATEDEAPLATLAAGPEPDDPGPERPGLAPLDLQAQPLSSRVRRDKDILAAHAQGVMEAPGPEPVWLPAEAPEKALELPRPGFSGFSLLEVVRRRRSRRNFIRSHLTPEQLSGLLAAALPASGPVRAAVVLGPGREITAGTYRYHPETGALATVTLGEDRRRFLAEACLGQMWVGQAALCLVLWIDLADLENKLGPRAYRLAMLEAGRIGQRLYLAATALGLGCCGVGAFYDAEAAQAAFIPPGGLPVYVLAAGPVKGLEA